MSIIRGSAYSFSLEEGAFPSCETFLSLFLEVRYVTLELIKE